MSMSLPARCTRCGFVWESTSYAFQGVTNLRLSGSTTNCIKCGAIADIAEGLFDIHDRTITVKEAPQSTRDMFVALQATIEHSIGRGETPEKTLQRATERAPKVVAMLTNPAVLGAATVFGGAAGIVSAILTIAQMVISLRPANLPDDDVRRIAREVQVMTEQRAYGGLPGIPQQLPRADPKEHSGNASQRIDDRQNKPAAKKRKNNKHAKRKN